MTVSRSQPNASYTTGCYIEALYLYKQQEKVKIKVRPAHNILIRHGHEDTAPAIRENGDKRIVDHLRNGRGLHRRRRRSGRRFVSTVGLLIPQLYGVVSLLVVGHIEAVVRGGGGMRRRRRRGKG